MMSLPARAGRHCYGALNPLHSALYFAPDLAKELRPHGVDHPSAVYFAGRAAPLGAVGAATVSATFYNFRPELVARHVPRVWELVTPAAALEARLRATDSMLHRLLGQDALTSPEMTEAADLALRAAEGCAWYGRPLYAAHAALPVPREPHLRLWHAATLLREHRGDGHLAVLLRERLDPLEALVSHTASGHGMTPSWVLTTRGWTQQDWAGAQDRLRRRGLLAADGELTEDGMALRKEIEHETDRLDLAPYEHLGADGVQRLTELAGAFALRAAEAGAFPADLFGKG
ncbi:hypothetical protein PJ985_19640 [Streptomyces sp. ACA25]|uniref:SCO6745 family protein n=1 Tax=Streptomyces sp. ACA25 TaxID=3022596 RepID=UPI002307C5BD|nr:hypothetical protein [Streptomyces sp. ACA25]MDB1089772.1 hypothetical protein [Streptomyces sp. ACA25]